MRKQQFVNFLKDYLQDVSGLETCNIHKLAKAMTNNLRIRDCLVLYCALNGGNKAKLLNKYTNEQYKNVLSSINGKNFLTNSFEDFDFQKIWISYQNKINRIENSNYTKEKTRLNIVRMMKEKRISNYRVYKDLNLNPGNINDYLTNGNVKKVSLNTVRDIFDYVYAY